MGSEQKEVNANVNESTVDAHNGHVLCQDGVSGDCKSNEAHNSDEQSGNLKNVPYIYRQDIVKHKRSGAIGIVNEVAGDSDSDSSITDDEEDEEDEEDNTKEDEGIDGSGDNKAGEGNESFIERNNDTLQADHIRVLWMDETKPVQHINDVVVVDRGFLHGDYVASASDPTGQVGLVADVNITVDLLALDGTIIEDISSRDLKRVREFIIGDFVVLGPWLGRVDDVSDNVTVLIDDGSVCKVIGADPLHLKPISKNFFDEEEHSLYYPGQRVKASSSSVFKNSRWLSGLWKANRSEATVTKVSTGSVYVYWIASAGCGPDSSTPPAEEQSPKNLKLLSCFAHTIWQVGDWCMLSSSIEKSSTVTLNKDLSKLKLHDSIKRDSDSSLVGDKCYTEEVPAEESYTNHESPGTDPAAVPDQNNIQSSSSNPSTSVPKEPVHETWPLHRKKIRKVVIRREKKARKKEENFEKALQIVCARTRVDVAWQDGSIQRGVDSTLFIPVDSPGDHEFVAEEYVVEKASDDVENDLEVRRVGVVKSVNAKERTACVRWLKPVNSAEDPREFDTEEIVSVYELEGHPDYEYAYGDVVVRLSPVTVPTEAVSEGELSGQSNQRNEPNESINGSKQLSESNKSNENFSSLSWVGNITGLSNGDIEVTWADGMVSRVGPHAIFVVGRDDDDNSIAAGSEISDAATWETVNDDEMDNLENVQDEVSREKATDTDSGMEDGTEKNTSGRNPAFSLPLAALDFVTRFAAGIFSRGRKDKDENELLSESATLISGERNSYDESSSSKPNAIDNCGSENIHREGEAEDFYMENSDTSACFEDNMINFKRFDIANDPLDHHFLGSTGKINNGRKWFKKVQQDWNILQNNLPDGIYVRVYEDRMDLLRAVIVGAYGTPYQDGLFFFDFHLPPEYPDVPPSAFYHSGGWRINPNLYEEGKVCLSLLNTWTGRGNEVWDPKSSSILQVLVSLQGLVLNSKPYFNEAGYDKQIGTAEGEKNSLSYNENTFLLNCKTMMYLIRRRPKDFDELVKEHFKRRGHYILKACDTYMKGSLIGSLTHDASAIDKDGGSDLTSVGFKLMLVKIVPKLYMALNEIGADCDEFKHLLQS